MKFKEKFLNMPAIFKHLFVLIIILIFIKVDFRLEPEVYCCSDDHDYYSHSETIALDFDFDYTNQLQGYEDARFNKGGKIAPIGFVGSGILAAPFLYLGNLLDRIVYQGELVSFKVLLYSFSSIFYLGLSIYYLTKIKNQISPNISNFKILLIIFGSGISYYAFERFSMTHVYEIFTITMISYHSLIAVEKASLKNRDINVFLLLFYIFLALNVRWVNYFVLLIPYFLPRLVRNKKANFLSNRLFVTLSVFFTLVTVYLNNQIYGVPTLNPNFVYSSGIISSTSNLLFNIPQLIKSMFLILFGQEFGILYFSPIIFFGLFLTVFNLIKKSFSIYNFLGLLMFFQVFAIVILWQSTASSYGYRYLLSLTPLSVILFLNYYKESTSLHKEKLLNLLVALSTISLLSTLFFETTELTQLSLTEEVNSFGNLVRYTEPEYLKGFLLSFASIDSYLKIFVTSFLGLVFFNILFRFLEVDQLLMFIENMGIQINNEKTFNLLDKYSQLSNEYLIIIIVFVLSAYVFFNKLIFNT